MKLIALTDTHLVGDRSRLWGLDPVERLRSVVAEIARWHGDAALALLLGDVADAGEPEAYALAAEALSGLAIPHWALIGNHDDRATLLASALDAPEADGFVQGARDVEGWRLIALDSQRAGETVGELCDRRLDWLDRQLAGCARALLFMHHPPAPIGHAGMDALGLAEPERLADALARRPGVVRHVFCGHVHRPVRGVWRGVPFACLRGTAHQVWNGFASGGGVLGSWEPPSYAVIETDGDDLRMDAHEWLDPSPKFAFEG